jgi:hypothetical protein
VVEHLIVEALQVEERHRARQKGTHHDR